MSDTRAKHLWEIRHPYYCNEGNYFASGGQQPNMHYESWGEFLDEEGDSDMDYNLLFRWDWRPPDPKGEQWDNEDHQLLLFWMGQRKGLYRWTTIDVKPEDEEAVREFLNDRWDYLKSLWEGIS